MKKLVTTCSIITSLVLSPALRADGFNPIDKASIEANAMPSAIEKGLYDQTPIGLDTPPIEADTLEESNETMSADQSSTQDDEFNQGTPVGQASNEGARTARRKRWQNFAIAATAVAVAIIALVLVAHNDGHKKS